MIDMAFLLITFFIMSIRFGQEGDEKVKLPDADQAKEITDERVQLITVNVTGDGTYVIGGTKQTSGELLTYFKARKDEGENRKMEIVIRGDRKSEFNAIQKIMRMSAEAGIPDVSLAALQRASEDPE